MDYFGIGIFQPSLKSWILHGGTTSKHIADGNINGTGKVPMDFMQTRHHSWVHPS
jgi:hypothetical protein